MEYPPFITRDLGRMEYQAAFELQQDLQREVIAQRATNGGDGRMYLLLVEHDPPVITISNRPGARKHLVATEDDLRREGVVVCPTNRGGDITYHGPGQLVVYPIFDLNTLGLRLHGYMRFLEQVVIDVLAGYGVAGHRDPVATGVWVEPADATRPHAAPAKMCAMGVRVSRWVAMHGLALNITTDLAHFDLIVPCGLADSRVTSMQRELGDACPTMEQVKTSMVQTFEAAVAAHAASSGA